MPRFDISKTTCIFSLYIIIQTLFILKVWSWIAARITESRLERFIVLAFLGILLIYAIYCLSLRLPLFKYVLILLLTLAGCYFIWKIKIFVEKIHVFQFAILGFLLKKDLLKKSKLTLVNLLVALVFILLFSSLDEFLQYWLPNRVADIRDVCINFAGGSLGLSISYLVSEKT